ncbi:MAG: ABC transporter permease [Cyanobacteria bacterium J06592_8]
MNLRQLSHINELNPQLFREIKGRLTRRNLALSIGLSLLGQLFVYFLSIGRETGLHFIRLSSEYCNDKALYLQYQQQYEQISNQLYSPAAGSPPIINREALEVKLSEISQLMNSNCPSDAINVSLWWRDYWTEVFMVLSVFGFFALIVVGTYMLINDLATEQRRGTLNFIRLSPQTYKGIFVGKIFGVPSLLYLTILLMVPYHLWLGVSSGLPILEILGFYGIVIASCAFFYSFALLFGLMTGGLSGFQSWLGSGAVLSFLLIANNKPIYQDGADWLNLFSPSFLLRYLVNKTDSSYLSYPFNHEGIQDLQWFELPLGISGTLILCFSLFHLGLWTFWLWKGLERRYQNPNSTLFSKRQSYWITGCFTVANLGFTLQRFQLNGDYIGIGLFWNLLLFLILIAALSPQRQTLQDWARYRRERVNGKAHLLSDLIEGERSPAVVAIGLNLLIVIILFGLTTIWVASPDERLGIFAAVLLNASLIWICASLAQLILLMKTPKRTFWAAGTVGVVLILPVTISAVFGLKTSQEAYAFLFSPLSFIAIEQTTSPVILLAIASQVMMTILFNLRLSKQLKKAGESTSKALLTGHSS